MVSPCRARGAGRRQAALGHIATDRDGPIPATMDAGEKPSACSARLKTTPLIRIPPPLELSSPHHRWRSRVAPELGSGRRVGRNQSYGGRASGHGHGRVCWLTMFDERSRCTGRAKMRPPMPTAMMWHSPVERESKNSFFILFFSVLLEAE